MMYICFCALQRQYTIYRQKSWDVQYLQKYHFKMSKTIKIPTGINTWWICWQQWWLWLCICWEEGSAVTLLCAFRMQLSVTGGVLLSKQVCVSLFTWKSAAFATSDHERSWSYFILINLIHKYCSEGWSLNFIMLKLC